MNIVVALKVVPDDQDLQTAPDGSLDASRAKPVVSSFDLNALEAAAQMAAANPGSSLIALTAGPPFIDDSKLRKNILARGPEQLVCVIDAALDGADSHMTAQVIAAAVKRIGECDLLLFGDGSADVYAQQTGIQAGELLSVPVVNAVSELRLEPDGLVATRTLEDVREVVAASLPAAVCVTSDIATPRICAMKDILAAGKKPVTVWTCADLGCMPKPGIEVQATWVPKPADRKNIVYDASVDGDVDKFIAAIASELGI